MTAVTYRHGLTVPVDVPDRPRWLRTSCTYCGRKWLIHRSEQRTFKPAADCPRGEP